MDLFAAEIDMDPAELRRRNYRTPEAFPLTTPTGASYDSGDYRASLEAALEAAGYDGLRAEQAARRERGDHRLMGIGVSTYVEVTSPIGPVCTETGRLELRPDGTVLARTGATPFGQGHVTTLSMVAVDDAGTLLNPLGAKGIGESGTVGATPAVQNAVVDALSHLGIRHLDMPASPQKVWAP